MCKKHLTTNATLAQRDPTKTLTLRRRFVAQMKKRFSILKKDITTSIVTNDAFGLNERQGLNLLTPAAPGAFDFPLLEDQISAFNAWLLTEIDNTLLDTVSTIRGAQPWTDPFIASAYAAGQRQGTAGLRTEGILIRGVESVFEGTLGQGVPASRVRVLQARAFTELRGVTNAMAQQISSILTDGLIAGDNPSTIAAAINERVDAIGLVRANTLARTEIIRAHHMGNIDTLEAAGVQGVKVLAEWATAGDARVCPNCAVLEGRIFTLAEIRGLIPLHPNCRCVALPAGVGETVNGKDRFVDDIPEESILGDTEEVQELLDVVPVAQRVQLLQANKRMKQLERTVQKQEQIILRTAETTSREIKLLQGGISHNQAGLPIATYIGELPGPNGYNGLNGAVGRGIVHIEQIERDVLVHMNDGSGYRLLNMKADDVIDGVDGINGIGIKDIDFENNTLAITLTDNSRHDLGNLKGEPGVGFIGAELVDGEIVIQRSDGKALHIGKFPLPELPIALPIPNAVQKIDRGKKGALLLTMTDGEEIALNAHTPIGVITDIEIGPRGIRWRKNHVWSKWVRLRRGGGGGGGGLSFVSTDDTLTGDGTAENPLSVVGGGGEVGGADLNNVMVHEYDPEGNKLAISPQISFNNKGQITVSGGFTIANV